MTRAAVIFMFALALAGCGEKADTQAPAPATLTGEAVGYYCQMTVQDHDGPKAQIFLAGDTGPLWFAQVRDGVAFLREPEKKAEIAAFYVSDMARAPNWQSPGNENWIAADAAIFVVGSDATGGMGAPEVVPFGTRRAAAAFAAEHGGTLMLIDEIPPEAVLGAVEMPHQEGK